MISLGVIADTHVPDKTPRINPRVFEIFQNAGVQAILHAGDISKPVALAQLEQIAPVYAVKGNRDWVYLRSLPRKRILNFDGVKVGLAHGHGGILRYFVSKYYYLTQGYRLENFSLPLLADFPEVRVIVFGHTHRPINKWVNGIMLFNPGSACCTDEMRLNPPSVGLLHIEAGQIMGEIFPL